MKAINRRYDLDWLRVIAFGLLMLFHTGMLFSSWNWHVKNYETSPYFDYVMRFLHEWRMPLLFFISGSAVWFALDRTSTWRFFLGRQQRLLLPVVFGMLVIIPPQVYFERLYHQQFYANFWDFYRTIFTSGTYPAGNLSWHHLWYVPYIWAYSMLLLPLLIWLRSRSGQSFLAVLHSWAAKPWLLFFIFVPTALSDILLRPFWPGDACNLIDDWANFTHKLCFFLGGYLLASAGNVYDVLARHRARFLVAGSLALCVLFPVWFMQVHVPFINAKTYRVLSNFHVWMWILAALGFGRRYLNFNHRALKVANEAVYPFYILHQTVIIMLGYCIVGLNWALPLKFVVVVIATFSICGLLYAFVIRPWNVVRICFGMKPTRQGREQAQPAASGGWVPTAPILNTGVPLRVCVVGTLVMLAAGWSWSGRQGKLLTRTFDAPALAANELSISQRQRLAIYLPPGYHRNPERRYPVLYYLPNFNTPLWRYNGGWFQGFRFKDAMDRVIAQSSAAEMILVIPNALHTLGGSWYHNGPLTGDWEDYVVRDVVAFVDREYRTEPRAEERALAGHGMGGSGALMLALRHPDVFGHVYAMTPAVFDQKGMEDFGILAPGSLQRFREQITSWDRLAPDERRRAFRDLASARLNSSDRRKFGEALQLSYLAAFSSDRNLPFPHLAIPTDASAHSAAIRHELENGLGGWDDRLDAYLAQGSKLKSITIEYTSGDEYQWIRRGAEYVSALMKSKGIANTLAVHEGGHDSTLGSRLETAMLTTVSGAWTKRP